MAQEEEETPMNTKKSKCNHIWRAPTSEVICMKCGVIGYSPEPEKEKSVNDCGCRDGLRGINCFDYHPVEERRKKKKK